MLAHIFFCERDLYDTALGHIVLPGGICTIQLLSTCFFRVGSVWHSSCTHDRRGSIWMTQLLRTCFSGRDLYHTAPAHMLLPRGDLYNTAISACLRTCFFSGRDLYDTALARMLFSVGICMTQLLRTWACREGSVYDTALAHMFFSVGICMKQLSRTWVCREASVYDTALAHMFFSVGICMTQLLRTWVCREGSVGHSSCAFLTD